MSQIGDIGGMPVYEGELPDDLDMSKPWALVPKRDDAASAGQPVPDWWTAIAWNETGYTDDL